MKNLLLKSAMAFILAGSLSVSAWAENSFPIVMVQGATGWESEFSSNHHYWGAEESLVEALKSNGYTTFDFSKNPMASSWDRACELYAYLKGGQVDYGAAHSEEHGHERFGATYEGIMPEWGRYGDRQKIHLVGHSTGGQVIRMLAHLLQHGSERERSVSRPGELSPLFEGGRDWVLSLTTISTPHQGTTVVDGIKEIREPRYWMMELAQKHHEAGLAEDGNIAAEYDFQLGQWGLQREDEESYAAYLKRVRAHKLWRMKDSAVYEMSLAGATKINEQTDTVPSVYYFSWANKTTEPMPGTGYAAPDSSTNPLLWLSAFGMGKPTSVDQNSELDEHWWDSDGVVNTVSMSAPVDDPVIVENQLGHTAIRGQWQHMATVKLWDHYDIIGHQSEQDVESFYLDWAKYLQSLENTIPTFMTESSQ